ncbi:ATP-dependent RecD-like DNA helicase [Capnocytophaga canimorsus]|uniref:ATP-dependent DNA helicase n=1 Tax=Capnocytophaga canimorsus TaxID=28188 RepID=UPI00385F24DC
MDKQLFYKTLLQSFEHTPTSLQKVALQLLTDFLFATQKNKLFLLKGFAGTGKTSIVNCLSAQLGLIKQRVVLLAPTGRAAKVMTSFSGQEAFTIHKYIYYTKNQSGGLLFSLKPNKHKNTLFVVDEASMIADIGFEGSDSVLDDLMRFVYQGENCRLLLMGDTAQLPPVTMTSSPALDIRNLEVRYGKEVTHIELTEVVRQEKNSGILYNATRIRECLFEYFTNHFRFEIRPFKDIVWLTEGVEIQEAIQDSYALKGIEQSTIVVRSNKRAVLYNKQIRQVILGQESELASGDLLMVVKNNYYWLKGSNQVNFIANGDTLEVLRVYTYKDLYGFRFAEVNVRLIDYPNQPPFDTVLLLDTLTSEWASLSAQDTNRLYQEVLEDYADESSAYKKYMKVKENTFFNALQVKFSYAITCHKSQGGQWAHVFIEKPYLPDGVNEDYLRWLYTALTRATEKIYLINFKEEDFWLDDEY